MNTDALMSALVSDCIARESLTFHMYRDSLGYPTVGIGNKVDSPAAAERLPFVIQPGGLTPSDDWRRVYSMQENHPAVFYRSDRSPLLPPGYPEVLCRKRLNDEFLPGIAKILPDVMTFPVPAIRSLVAMSYCLGVGGLIAFKHMIAACQERDWRTAAASCHIRSARKETNDRHEAWFLAAATGTNSV